LLSSHILAEAEALSDRVSIVRDGRCVETGTLAELRHLTRTSVDAEVAGAISLAGVPGVHDLTAEGQRIRCQVDNDALTDVLGRLTAAGILTIACRPPTLEELFLRHYVAGRDVAGIP
jgi:ABC-2 type transport system ATP-binding protein